MKQKKLKNNYISDEQKEVRNLIIITVIIAAIAAGLYFFTEKVLNKKDNTDNNTEVEFDYNVCTIGNMFTRPYDEYYVFIYSSEDESAASYTALITSYRDKKAKKFILSAKQYRGDTAVMSIRLPSDMIKAIDKIAEETGRTRNEIIQKSIAFALDNIEIHN